MAGKRKSGKSGAPRPTGSGGDFPVVGIGASAGGLEAFEAFFDHCPSNSGMAFVLVQHLDPSHASILGEILQRTTAMEVLEAQHGMVVAPNRVYVIPSNRDLAIGHGVLQLSVPALHHAQRMPIDAFLRTLAEDRGQSAVGVILSGTGTDGTQGLRAILGAGGVTLVQEPATAKYDGMPISAIRAGYATHVLPVEEMPAMLSVVRSRRPVTPQRPMAAGALERILRALRAGTGHDFAQYKRSTMGRRIERRMLQHGIENIEGYADYLKEHPPEVQALFKELLINVTSFFRDPKAFEVLKEEILPQLLAGMPEDHVFRIWVAGCASGEEAYSIAMVLREVMDKMPRKPAVLLFATDLDEEEIEVARAGLYPPNITQDVEPQRLRRFFTEEEAGYRVKKEIREMVVFAVQNVIKDPPFTGLDMISCRNLLIYLDSELQDRLIPTFHYALNPGGVLFLSSSESTGDHPELFEPLNRKWKFYRAVPSNASTRAVMAGGPGWAAEAHAKEPGEVALKAPGANLAELTRCALLDAFAPAAVVTDHKGNILYVYGDTGRYLRPAPGKATLNLMEMAREGLKLELRTALTRATQRVPTPTRAVTFKIGKETVEVNIGVRPLPEADAHEGLLLVSFQEAAPCVRTKTVRGKRPLVNEARRIDELERELAYSRENLQATVDEQHGYNEELQSANEELQSTNEELQSTNEELETSREELQSLNEELVTVNAELQGKIEQLAGMQNDMKNLFDNISAGVVFLDRQLAIRRFTRQAAQVYRLVTTDVGRPLADIKSDLRGEDLLVRAQTVLDGLAPWEGAVQTVDGVWYLARLQPYRTLDDVIDGVVLTFTDISQRIEAEAEVHAAKEFAEGIVDTVREPLVVLDNELRVVSASRSFYRDFNMAPEQTVGRTFYELGERQWDIPALRDLLESVLPRDQSFEGFVAEYDLPGIGPRQLVLNARRLIGGGEKILLALESVH